MNKDETLDLARFENEPQLALQIAEAIATKIQRFVMPIQRRMVVCRVSCRG
jgi:hypothetical protein